MATEHNRRFAAAQRRQKVTELYVQGWSQSEIAQHLNVAQSTISEDVQQVRKQWERSAVRNFSELRAREVQKLDYVEREAWAAWQRSQKPAQSAIVTEQSGGQHTRKSLKQQTGDPRFLDQVNKCILQRRALLGLDALPAPTSLEGSADAQLSLEARRDRVYALFTAIVERERIGTPGKAPADGQPRDVCGGSQRGTLEDGPPRRLPGPDAALSD